MGELHATTLSRLAVSSLGARASVGRVAKSPPWAPRDQEEQRPLDEVGDPMLVDSSEAEVDVRGFTWQLTQDGAGACPWPKFPVAGLGLRDRSAGTECAQGLHSLSGRIRPIVGKWGDIQG